jgi:hypothetical protein
MVYQLILFLHVLITGIYFIYLSVRTGLLWFSDRERLLLYQERSRVLNIVLLSILLLSGIYLGFEYDFSEGLWFVIKLLLLGLAAFWGDYAFRNFNKWVAALVLLLYLYVILISYTKPTALNELLNIKF